MGPIEPSELKKILDNEGLFCCATHESGKDIVEDINKVIDKLKTLGCKYTAYPFPHVKCASGNEWKKLALQLNESGKKMKDNGLTLCYHNHGIEFHRYDGKTALDIIYDATDKQYLQGEIDTYWVQYGGGNPVEWCRKLSGRLPLLHLKEYGILDN